MILFGLKKKTYLSTKTLKGSFIFRYIIENLNTKHRIQCLSDRGLIWLWPQVTLHQLLRRLDNYVTFGKVYATPKMRRLEDELCNTKTVHRWEKGSTVTVFLCLDFCVCICAHSRICVFFLVIFLGYCIKWGYIGRCAYVSMYKPHIHAGLIANLRRGRSWHDWWRRQLAGYYLPVWSSKNGCFPGRGEMKRNRMSRRQWIHQAGRK